MKGYVTSDGFKKLTTDKNGFFDTGDIGEYIDGILFIKGRSKDIVKKGGEILSLNFIENMAMKNDNVLECAAVGKQDTLMGETIILFIKFHKIINILDTFIGEIDQIPPMFSALKKNGKRLYHLARKGIRIEREPRKILIKKIELISCFENSISIKVECGKGTYIRSLARDIAHSLNTEGYVKKLIRTRIGHFDEKSSISVKDFKHWLLYQQHIQN